MRLKGMRGQGMLEIVVMFAVVIAAILGMQVFLKRAVEGRLKSSADAVGTQWDAKTGTYRVSVTSTSHRLDTVGPSGFTESAAGVNAAGILVGDSDIQKRVTVEPELMPAPAAGATVFD